MSRSTRRRSSPPAEPAEPTDLSSLRRSRPNGPQIGLALLHGLPPVPPSKPADPAEDRAVARPPKPMRRRPLLPLDYLLRILREPEPVPAPEESAYAFRLRWQEWSRRTLTAAIHAAPYCHPRLQAVQHVGGGAPIRHRHEIVFVRPPDAEGPPATSGG